MLDVAVEFAQGEPQPLRRALLAACSEAAEIHCEEDAASEVADYAALVVWDGAEHRVLRIEVVQTKTGALRARDVRFAATDPDPQRFAAAGYVIASLVSGKPQGEVNGGGLAPHDAAPSAPAPVPRWWHLRAELEAATLGSEWLAFGGGVGTWLRAGAQPLPWFGAQVDYLRGGDFSVTVEQWRGSWGGLWRVPMAAAFSWNSGLLGFFEARAAGQQGRSAWRRVLGAAVITEAQWSPSAISVHLQLGLWAAPGTRILGEGQRPSTLSPLSGRLSLGAEF